MKHTKWVCITHQDNIPLREGRAVTLDGQELALFNLGDRFLAIQNRCPHRGGPLSDGMLTGSTVVCALHAWKVCLNTGKVTRPESDACLATYRTRVQDGLVSIEIPVSRPASVVQQPAFHPQECREEAASGFVPPEIPQRIEDVPLIL
jgi:nitrite reductase (NADH) small subunit